MFPSPLGALSAFIVHGYIANLIEIVKHSITTRSEIYADMNYIAHASAFKINILYLPLLNPFMLIT